MIKLLDVQVVIALRYFMCLYYCVENTTIIVKNLIAHTVVMKNFRASIQSRAKNFNSPFKQDTHLQNNPRGVLCHAPAFFGKNKAFYSHVYYFEIILFETISSKPRGIFVPACRQAHFRKPFKFWDTLTEKCGSPVY